MSELLEFHIQNVRCFRVKQRVPIRPITLLVGENNTGKTTFLGCYRVLRNLLGSSSPSGVVRSDFNEAPFSLGTFREIVSSGRGSRQFKLGAKLALPSPSNGCDVAFNFVESNSAPKVAGVEFCFGPNQVLEVHFQHNGEFAIRITGPGFSFRVREFDYLEGHSHALQECLWLLEDIVNGRNRNALAMKKGDLNNLADFLQRNFPTRKTSKLKSAGLVLDKSKFSSVDQLFAAAPIRSKPMRSYDPHSELAMLEKEPFSMDLVHNSLHDAAVAEAPELVAFGKASGMFSEINVRRHGKKASDPFQVMVKALGPAANIVNVGYGVSQVLPIVTAIAKAHSGGHFLLQQPEVHLHPRGQAALATFFIEELLHNNHSFLIETHSDYMIDRFRISVRKGKLKPEDVTILFFAPSRSGVDIYPIALDSQGNLLDTPKKYRDFFIDEYNQLLGYD